MITLDRNFRIYMLMFFVCASISSAFATDISPLNSNIQYIGRFDMSNVSTPRISWTGTQINIRFEGTSLKIRLTGQGETYFRVQINSTVSKLYVGSGSKTYDLCTGLKDTIHTASIMKVTAPWSAQNFEGFIIDNGKALLTPPTRKVRKIEIYGDSQTQGARVEIPGMAGDTDDLKLDNTYYSYASMIARSFNAECHIIAQSGATLAPLPNKLAIPSVYDRTGAGTTYSLWDFSKWTPDVVCINLGVNDNPVFTEYLAKYVDFITKIRGKYPNAHIFLLSGPMSNNATLENHIKSVVSQLNNSGDSKVYYFKPTNYIQHPGHNRIVDNVIFANELTNFIRTKIWNEPTAAVEAEEVYITPALIPLSINGSRQLKAYVLPFYASQTVTWTSSNPEVAQVSSTGVVTGKSAGSALIQATTQNGVKSYEYKIEVQDINTNLNLISNSGFEDGLNLWNSWGNSILNIQGFRSGQKALELGPNAGGMAQIVSFAVGPNTTYTVSAWGKILAGAPRPIIAISMNNTAGSSTWLSSGEIKSSQYEQTALTFTTPANVFSIQIVLRTQAAGSVVFDDIQLVKGSSPTGLKDLTFNLNSINLFPNPVTNGKLFYSFDKNENKFNSISIFSMSGHSVFAQNQLPQNNYFDISNLKKGLYAVRFEFENNIVDSKNIIVN